MQNIDLQFAKPYHSRNKMLLHIQFIAVFYAQLLRELFNTVTCICHAAIICSLSGVLECNF